MRTSVSVVAPVKKYTRKYSGLIQREKAEVIKPEGGLKDLIEEAIDSCPASCIYEKED